MADQGSATPILRDMGKHPMLNLIPLTGPRRQMAHRNGQAQRIGQALQLRLPQPCAPAVTAARWFVPRNFLKKLKLRLLS